MSYKINPCKAVIKKVEDSNCDINTMNDLCYGVARAYGGAYGPDLQKKLEAQCADLISEKKCSNGQTNCYMKRPSPPPSFNQMPRHFPYIFRKCNDIQKSYKDCCSKCDDSRYPNTCMDHCLLDANAIQKIGGNGSKESYDDTPDTPVEPVEPDYDGYSKAHPLVFFLGFIVIVTMMILLVWYFMRGLTTKI